MDKKTLRMLEYIASAPCRSYDEIEKFIGSPLETSLEYRTLFIDEAVYDATPLVKPADNISRLAVTPHGREILEHYHDERIHRYITLGTFLLSLISIIFTLLDKLNNF